MIILFLIVVICGCVDPPKATEIPYVVEKFGVELSDPYHYFSDNITSPLTKKYLDAENDWAENNAYDENLVKTIESELEKYMGSSLDTSNHIAEFPTVNLEYYKFVPLKGYGKWYRRPIGSKEEGTLVFDENQLFEDVGKPDFFSVPRIAPSPDHKIIAFLYDTLGNEIFTIGFRDLTTGTILGDRVENSYYGVVWSEDSKRVLFEVIKNLPVQPLAVGSYEIGSMNAPVEVFSANDETFEVGIKLSSDREMIIFTEDSFHGISCSFLSRKDFDKTDISGSITAFPIPFQTDIEYTIDHSPIGFIVLRQSSVDSNFGVYLYNETAGFSVTTIFTESDETIVKRIDCFYDVLYVWGYNTTNIRPFVNMYSYSDLSTPTPIDFDSLMTQNEKYSVEPYFGFWFPVLGGARGYFNSQLKFKYSSLVIPPRTYVFDPTDGTSTHLKLLEAVEIEDYDPTLFEDDTLFVDYTTKGGVEVPVSICYKKYNDEWGKRLEMDLKKRPVWVYSYGSYGAIINPSFRDYMLPMLDRGFVFAIVHVRGSSIRGMKYYHDGYRRNKKHTWEDFNAVLDYFKTEEIAAENQIVTEGRSAGGLTVTRAMLSNPELVDVMIAGVPFVDVLNTMMEPELPYTVMERTQWGDPSSSKADFDYIYSYDPYYTLKDDEDFPNMYFQAGLNDQRVHYAEPLKFMAKMRSWGVNSKRKNVIRVQPGGHFGSNEGEAARLERAKLQAFVVYHTVGVEYDIIKWLKMVAGSAAAVLFFVFSVLFCCCVTCCFFFCCFFWAGMFLLVAGIGLKVKGKKIIAKGAEVFRSQGEEEFYKDLADMEEHDLDDDDEEEGELAMDFEEAGMLHDHGEPEIGDGVEIELQDLDMEKIV